MFSDLCRHFRVHLWFSRNGKTDIIGYYYLRGIAAIIEGVLTILAAPFGYNCNILPLVCDWHIRRRLKNYHKGK